MTRSFLKAMSLSDGHLVSPSLKGVQLAGTQAINDGDSATA